MIHEEEGKSCANRARKLPNTARANIFVLSFPYAWRESRNAATTRHRSRYRGNFNSSAGDYIRHFSAIFCGVTVKYRCSFAARGRDDLIIYLMNLYYLLFSALAREFDQIRIESGATARTLAENLDIDIFIAEPAITSRSASSRDRIQFHH